VVGRGVKLLGDVTVGSDCWIRPNATIKRSILLPGRAWGTARTSRTASWATTTTCVPARPSGGAP
jgi:acetyltransferase-like isoleucine patch superfamily enzyme